MAADLRDQLQATLGGSYAIERDALAWARLAVVRMSRANVDADPRAIAAVGAAADSATRLDSALADGWTA